MSEARNSRVAVVAGLRTPFAKQGSTLAAVPARDLGKTVVAELVQRAGLDRGGIDRVVFGQVIPTPSAPNIAREVALGSGLGTVVDAYSVSRACVTSYQAMIDLVLAIQSGDIECGVAGGADSASDIPISLSRRLTAAILRARRARSLAKRIGSFAGVRPRDLLPVAPVLREPSSRYSMGESAEKMARENRITRSDQDAYAHESHRRAAAAWDEGFFTDQVMTTFPPPGCDAFAMDNTVRRDSDLAQYGKLDPAFDPRHGTVTAGNSSPLTDGAAALLLMRADKAAAAGHVPLGFIRSYAFCAIDPDWQMLMGPAFVVPRALARAGLALGNIDLVDIHEAFAAQVLSNLRALASPTFAVERLGQSRPVGEIDPARLNIGGGSIALGHPFAATGARQVIQVLHALRRRGGGLALCTACAAGGLGAAIVLESEG